MSSVFHWPVPAIYSRSTVKTGSRRVTLTCGATFRVKSELPQPLMADRFPATPGIVAQASTAAPADSRGDAAEAPNRSRQKNAAGTSAARRRARRIFVYTLRLV